MTFSAPLLRTTLAAAALIASASTVALAYEPGLIQTLNISSTRGATQMDQFYIANTVQPGQTRVCLVNMGAVSRSMVHATPGINPLTAAPGGQSCATFSAGARVAFGLVDGTEPAQANHAMVMSLGAFERGTVSFVWH